jgi:hypothetical protein
MADNDINRQNGAGTQQQSADGGMSQPGGARPGSSGESDDSEFRGAKLSGSPDGDGHVEDSDMEAELAMQIREDMTVVDAEGAHVGTVDRCEDGQIKLTRSDSRDGEHRFIPLGQVDNVEGETVMLRGLAGEQDFGQSGS